ncbi:Paf1-domain-containing protein [Paraphysoderma sedebokerense]|nr:Paf1-domain-containing protein [Paraphysoderma sedebokerense]
MSSKNQPSHAARRKQEFICRIKYSNSLPPQQFLPKSLIYPFPSDHLYSYKKTTLVENTPHNLLLPDQPIDLIKLGVFDLQNIEQPPKVNIKNAKVDPKDEPLLAQPADRFTNGMAGSRARPLVPWLRRTEYIGSESTQYGRQREDRSAAADIQPHKDRTREGQIRDIEATFEHAAAKNISTLKHPRKPHLKAVEMMPIFPELTLWPNDYCMIQFDGHPAESVPKRANSVNLSQTPQLYGILKPVQDPEDQSTVLTYYLPHEESVEILRKRQEKAEEEEDEFQDDELNYSYVREYDYAPAIDKQDSRVLFMLREGEGAFYSKIRSRVALKKRRAKVMILPLFWFQFFFIHPCFIVSIYSQNSTRMGVNYIAILNQAQNIPRNIKLPLVNSPNQKSWKNEIKFRILVSQFLKLRYSLVPTKLKMIWMQKWRK